MKLDQLTFTRFIAAISIVIFHFGQSSFLYSIFSKANIGVGYFFILSGFVMIVAYNDKPVVFKEYYINRFARIYPIYLLALLMVSTFMPMLNPTEFLLSFFVIQSWIPTYPLSLNYPSWSLSVESFFYALFPFLVNYVYKKFNFKTISFSILIFWVASQTLLNYVISNYYQGFPSVSHDLIFYFPIMHLNEFLIGNLAGLLFLKIKDTISFKYYNTFIIVFIIFLYLLFKYPLPFNYDNGFLAIIFVPLIILISLENKFISKILKFKSLIFLGEISYGIYILQVPIYNYYYIIINKLGFRFNLYIYIFILIIISSLSYLIIEKPLRYYIKSSYHRAKELIEHTI